jgi:NitT/TauT family transport system permease protein
MVTGIPLGLIIGNFKVARWLVEPVITFFRFVPAVALTTLFIMWFGTDDTSRVLLIFYSAFFPVFVNSVAGVSSTDKSLIEAASCMGAKKFRVFFTVILPSAVPSVFTGVRLGLSNALHNIIAAEMLVGNSGLGYLIQSSKLYYKTSWAFAGIATLAILGFVSDRLLVLAGNKLLGRFGVKL